MRINKYFIKDDFDGNYKDIVPQIAPSSSATISVPGNSQTSAGAEESL